MGTVRIFTPENDLAGIIGGPKDMTVDELERRAVERVGSMGPSLRAFVDERLAAIEHISLQPEETIFAESLALGDAALAICEVAATGDLARIGEAARGISNMVDALVSSGVWHTEALKLHVDALMMFAARPTMGAEEAETILKRLKAMRDGIGVPE